MSGQVIAKSMRSDKMKHEHRSPEGHSQVTEQVFTDRIAVIDLPPEMWDDNAEQKFVNVRGDEELLKRLDERLKHAVTLVRPAAPWRDGSYESWEAAYK